MRGMKKAGTIDMADELKRGTIEPTPTPRGLIQRLMDGLRTLKQMLRDPEYKFPNKTKWVVILALVYLILPVDFIPEILFPGLGFVDDVAFLIGAGAMLLEAINNYARSKR